MQWEKESPQRQLPWRPACSDLAVAADCLAARQDTLDLLHQFTDDQLAAPVPAVIGDLAAGDLFAGRSGHAAMHMT